VKTSEIIQLNNAVSRRLRECADEYTDIQRSKAQIRRSERALLQRIRIELNIDAGDFRLAYKLHLASTERQQKTAKQAVATWADREEKALRFIQPAAERALADRDARLEPRRSYCPLLPGTDVCCRLSRQPGTARKCRPTAAK